MIAGQVVPGAGLGGLEQTTEIVGGIGDDGDRTDGDAGDRFAFEVQDASSDRQGVLLGDRRLRGR